jgi:hypothetical protein
MKGKTMTAKDRADLSVALSEQLAAFLVSAGGRLEAGKLVRQFCESNEGVRLADAEIALSLLLNQRRLVVDSDLKLEQSLAQAA